MLRAQIYSHIVRAEKIQGSVDIMLFRDGIRPMWEDESNRAGGKWTLRLRKHGASLLWEELVLAMIGEQFDVGTEVCGAVLSVRYHDDTLSVWHRTADNEAAVARLRATYDVRAGVFAGGREKLIATMGATLMAVRGRDGIQH